MIIKLPTHTGIKLVVLVLGVLMLAGCVEMILYPIVVGIEADYKARSRTKKDSKHYDLSIKTELGVGIPINTPVVIHVNAINGEKYLSKYTYAYEMPVVDTPVVVDDEMLSNRLKPKRSDRLDNYSPLWYLAEESALDFFSKLSKNVNIDREIDKPDSLEESLLWYENRAIEYPQSAYKLGHLYHLGKEIPFNSTLANRWYLLSGVPAAKANVVLMWRNENPATAVRQSPDIDKLVTESWRYRFGFDANCGKETYESLMKKFRQGQELIVDTKGLSSYIFHISIDICGLRSTTRPFWARNKIAPQKTVILIKVFHSDGTGFGEYYLGYDDVTSGVERNLRAVTNRAFSEVANKLVNSESFVNHYRSLNKQ